MEKRTEAARKALSSLRARKAAAQDDVECYLQHVLQELNETPTGLARRIGVSTSTITRALKGAALSDRHLHDIADKTGVPLPQSLTVLIKRKQEIRASIGAALVDVAMERFARQSASDAGRLPAVLNGDLHIVGSASFRRKGLLIDREAPKGSVARPPTLAGVTAYAVYVPDDSMAPILRRGMVLYVDADSVPPIGSTVLAEMSDGVAHIRVLTAINDKTVSLMRLRPKEVEETVDLNNVRHLHLIAGWHHTR